MSLPNGPSAPETRGTEFRGSLRRSLIQTLVLLTIIPLIAMGLAAYLRASGMLRQQAITQMQSLLNGQMDDLVLLLKTKSIRLERLANRSDLTSLIEQALHVNRQSTAFNAVRGQLLSHYQTTIADQENPTFDQFFLIRPNGSILIASEPAWEGVSLRDTVLYRKLNLREPLTTTIFDLSTLYPQQLATFTIQPFITTSGSYLGSLVGVTETQSLTRILQPLIGLSPSADAYFVTATGALVGADPYTGELLRFDPSADQQSALDRAFATMGSTSQSSPLSLDFPLRDGNRVIAQAKWVPLLDAGVVLQMHESTVLGQINSLIPFTFIIVVSTLLAMALVIGAGINRLINPVISLTKITRRFAEGDLRSRATVESRDELGMLSHSFNQMADELGSLYRSLEQKVEERTRQIRTAAEVAQGITATTNLDELMRKTTQLIVDRFGYYHSAIFILDRSGKTAVIRAAYGPAAQALLDLGHSLEVGSNSIIGWATSNNKPRVASDVSDDPVHFKNALLPDTRAEAGIPISSGNLVFGALDVQSTEPNAFDAEAIIVLQTLANQIAAAIQNASLVESTQVNFHELERLYRSSRQIAQAQTSDEALAVVANALKDTPYLTALLTPVANSMRLSFFNDPENQVSVGSTIPEELALSSEEATRYLAGSSIFDLTAGNAPRALTQIPDAAGCQSAACLPITCGGHLHTILLIGSRRERLNQTVLQPYGSLADLTSITLEKILASDETKERLRELNALASVGQAVSTSTDTHELYSSLHKQIQNAIGDYGFSIALYEPASDTVQIPYSYEGGRVSQAESIPLGDGLISLLIHTQRPLLLVEDNERRATMMGARLVGHPAQSWMGAPMILKNQTIGALIVQDLEHEHAFDEHSLNFLSAISSQLAGVIYNTRLLEDSRLRALQLEMAAEIARDISSSLNLDELLSRAVNYIRDRFSFYHAAVFLLDLSGEYATIREATGEAGAQMKRSGHKLGVGSKSIVGYVAGRGEPLVINDTGKDPTYYANPLLPETRAEGATPLKVGDRILGVLDVQSTHAFAFNEDNLRTLQILADQLAIAVVNSELFSETQEHLSQHRLLHHITTSAASGTTLEEALSSAVNGLQVTLGGDRVSIFLVDRDLQELRIQASVGYSEDASQIRVPIGDGVTGWVAAHRRPLRVDNTSDEPRYIQLSPNTRSELAIPLIYRNEVLGVLNVESEQSAAYTDSDEEMLGTLGGSLAAIIANARLLEQIRAQAERERLLFEITGKIRRSTDIGTILATTAGELVKVLGARRTRIRIEPLSEPTKHPEDNASDRDGFIS